jgi:hypothetical protein
MAQPQVDNSRIEARLDQLDKMIGDLQIQLDNKASKESVAKHLHEKASKKEVEDEISRKADLTDLNRVFQSLDLKADQMKLDQAIRAIESQSIKTEVPKGSTFEMDSRV